MPGMEFGGGPSKPPTPVVAPAGQPTRSALQIRSYYIQGSPKLREPGGRNNDGVPPPLNILGDLEEFSAGVLTHGKEEVLSLDLDLLH